jgi:hypothetical protein
MIGPACESTAHDAATVSANPETLRAMRRGTKERKEPMSKRPTCDTPGCGREIPVGGEGHPEICPMCLYWMREVDRVRAAAVTYERASCDEVKRYKAETERQLQAKIEEIGTLLEEVNILRHRLSNLTFDDLSDEERMKAISRTLG